MIVLHLIDTLEKIKIEFETRQNMGLRIYRGGAFCLNDIVINIIDKEKTLDDYVIEDNKDG